MILAAAVPSLFPVTSGVRLADTRPPLPIELSADMPVQIMLS